MWLLIVFFHYDAGSLSMEGRPIDNIQRGGMAGQVSIMGAFRECSYWDNPKLEEEIIE